MAPPTTLRPVFLLAYFSASFLLLLGSLTPSVNASSSFVITEHKARDVKCFQSYSDITGLVERSICWHNKEFYADRWHNWPCEIDCDVNVPVRIYLEDYTAQYHREQQQLQELRESEQGQGQQEGMSRFTFGGRGSSGRKESGRWWNLLSGRGSRAGARGEDWRSIFKIYIQRLDSEWQLVTYLHKGTGDCKNEHDEDGWTIWACAEIKTV
ncbi:MAG: hypothetical protein J3R72DRAFT_458023 [Linnemannia gamsii]|nr:MAG: hypothetical protein J3R72DRAFT_458023 [Linnemannia gamsii]